MIKAVIFDMDGLLIDSDPFWKQAEIDVFKKVGINLSWEMAKSTSGLREDEAIEYWYKKYPWNTMTKKEVLTQIEDKVIERVQEKGIPLPGVLYVLDLLQENKIPMAVASASMKRVVEAILTNIKIKKYFQVIYSAEHEEYGKPHPGVYITTAKKLNVHPEECLVFEDSLRGLIAAKAAKMKCIVVPEKEQKKNKKFEIADKILDSLDDFKLEILQEI